MKANHARAKALMMVSVSTHTNPGTFSLADDSLKVFSTDCEMTLCACSFPD